MKRKQPIKESDFSFEESLGENIANNLEILEVPLSEWAIRTVGFFAVLAGIIVVGRVLMIAASSDEAYAARAKINLTETIATPAPRGIIYDRRGEVLAENTPSFLVFIDLKEFLANTSGREKTLSLLGATLGISDSAVWDAIGGANVAHSLGRVLVANNITQEQAVRLKDASLPELVVENGFRRSYPEGEAVGPLLGYVSLANAEDLKKNPNLSYQSIVGKSGIEASYNHELTGKEGSVAKFKDARGNILEESGKVEAEIGKSISLTIDIELQNYFFRRMQEGLRSLGRSVGVGLAMNPQTGEVLAAVNLPGYDNNVFLDPARDAERQVLLTSPDERLFDRIVSGVYNPGSTIKPLVGVAALSERVIAPEREIYSPGYLEIPNPYYPDKPSRFLDWRPQGYVDLKNAIAQSSNVYFYTVGGGHEDIKGLGIARLRKWWHLFLLDEKTGIDLPGEAAGVLPDPDLKEQTTGRPWLLGDTYNVSIGQGDLAVTPLALLNYVNAVANGGKFYRPFLNMEKQPELLADLSQFATEIGVVQKGMRAAVTSPLGTAHTLSDLPFPIGAKTGSAQIKNNTQVNAFFVGYAPFDPPAGGPEIAILVLVENAREGSLNAVPIAKDVLNWYYENRIKKP